MFCKTLLLQFSPTAKVPVPWHIAPHFMVTKHIEVHYCFVRDLVNSQVINLAYCPTQENVALTYLKVPLHLIFERLLSCLKSTFCECDIGYRRTILGSMCGLRISRIQNMITELDCQFPFCFLLMGLPLGLCFYYY